MLNSDSSFVLISKNKEWITCGWCWGVFAKLVDIWMWLPSLMFDLSRIIKSRFSKNVRGLSLFPKFCLNPLIILCGSSHVDFFCNPVLDWLPLALSVILLLTNMSFMDSIVFCISGWFAVLVCNLFTWSSHYICFLNRGSYEDKIKYINLVT